MVEQVHNEKMNFTGADTHLADPISAPSAIDAPLRAISSGHLDALAANLTELKGEVSSKPTTAAVILAGGSGERFGSRNGKQLFEILGRPVVTWAAEAFDAVPEVGLIVIVCPEDRAEEFCKRALDPFPFVTPIALAPAGSLRQESAFNGVNAVDEQYEYIAMHDGARPLITPDLITHAINTIKGNLDADGAIVGHPAIDTLKVVNPLNSVVGTPDRSLFWVAQTPQIFKASILREAHSRALAEGFVGTDDSSLVERLEAKILMVNGPRDNIKLTVPEDRGPIEAALQIRRGVRGTTM